MTTKRKKLEKAKDFQKKRLKVGKPLGSQIQSQTNTSFKSRSIHVPSQNIHDSTVGSLSSGRSASDLLQTLKTARNQTLHDLLCKLNHTNTSARLGALEGLVEILDDCDADCLSLILSRLAVDPLKLLFDPEQSVRRAVIKTYFGKLYTLISNEQDIMPHFPVIIVYLCSAMAHITVPIRTDSLKFLQLLIKSYPVMTVRYGMEKIVPNVIQLLVSDRASTTAEARLNLLQNLYLFLLQCFEDESRNRIKYEDGVHLDVEVDMRLDSLLLSSAMFAATAEAENAAFIPNPQTIQDVLDDNKQKFTRLILEVIVKIVPVLLDTWVDVYDQVFMATAVAQNSSLPFQTLKMVLLLVKLLLKYFRSSSDVIGIQTMINTATDGFEKIVANNFPLGKGLLKAKTYNAVYFDINILVADILSVYKSENFSDKVADFLSNELLIPEIMEKLNSEQVECLLGALDHSTVFMSQTMKLGLNSRVRIESRIEVYKFVKNILWRELVRPTADICTASDPVAIKWILSLPRLLWEVKEVDHGSWEVTDDILQFLSLVMRRDILQRNKQMLFKLMEPLGKCNLKSQWPHHIQDKFTCIVETCE